MLSVAGTVCPFPVDRGTLLTLRQFHQAGRGFAAHSDTRDQRLVRRRGGRILALEEVPLSRTGRVWSYTDTRYRPPSPFPSPGGRLSQHPETVRGGYPGYAAGASYASGATGAATLRDRSGILCERLMN